MPAAKKTGKRVGIIGSGPAGLAAAQQLARAGHDVVVFEKDQKIGGILRYGIPDFKLGKSVIDRRLKQLSAEGVQLQTDITVGKDISAHYLQKQFDCICLTMGAGEPRGFPVQGSGYENIVFAMDYLTAQNKINAGEARARCPRHGERKRQKGRGYRRRRHGQRLRGHGSQAGGKTDCSNRDFAQAANRQAR